MTIDVNQMNFKELRAIATSHPDWPAFMAKEGVNSASVKLEQLKGFVSSAQGMEYVPVAQSSTPQALDASPMDALSQAIRAIAGQSLDRDAIARIVAEEVKLAVGSLPSFKIELMSSGLVIGDLDGQHHPNFTELATIAASRLPNGSHPNIWIAGPAGSGKTHAVEQMATLLKLSYGSHGAMTMAHELVGFVDAGGKYHETQFVKAFINGGVCLLDELDAGENGTLLPLNGALANSHMSLPDGRMVERHKDFICVGAGNTWGLGGTADYIGRNKLDAAFLDRFVMLDWSYDVALEQNICGNFNWAKRVQAARARAKAAGLKVIISPRASINGAALIANGITEARAAQLTYLKTLSADQIRIVEGK